MTPVALTIAGNDPSGGAGIAADLKTFHQFGVYGQAVITLLTVQNTTRVSRIRLTAAATRELPRWLLLAICVIYGLSGLFSRDPWKNEDAAGFVRLWGLGLETVARKQGPPT